MRSGRHLALSEAELWRKLLAESLEQITVRGEEAERVSGVFVSPSKDQRTHVSH